MDIISVAVTDVGRTRQNNEDNFYLCGEYRRDVDLPNMTVTFSDKRDTYLFGVCDGMGGEAYGELASLIAVRRMDDYALDFDVKINEYVEKANAEICEEIISHDGKRIGTTLAALSISGNIARAYNVGDSRIYHVRDGIIKQVSEDHTQIQMLINQGFVSENDAKKHPARHILTQHLGIFPDEMIIEPFCAEPIAVQDGDIFLICSDGLTDTLADSDLLEILISDENLEQKANKLIESALNTGSRDNITVVMVEISEKSAPPETAKKHIDYEAAEALLNKHYSPGRAKLISEIMKMIRECE